MGIVLLFVVTAISVVSGQLLLARYVRALEPPWTTLHVLEQTLTGFALYGAVLAYGIGILSYLILLRRLTIVEVNLPILALLVASTIVLGFLAGESLSPIQWTGAVVAGIGIVLLYA